MLYLLLILIIVLLIDYFSIRDIKSLQFKNIKLHNELFTYNTKTHYNIISSYNFNKNINYDILEIGAGNGDSTNIFLAYLDNNLINYTYTICEIDNNYNELLTKRIKKCNRYILNKCKFINNSWEKLDKKFDIIITTAFSSVNKTNYELFKNRLCNKNTIIITMGTFNILYKIKELNLKIIKVIPVSLYFYIIIFNI